MLRSLEVGDALAEQVEGQDLGMSLADFGAARRGGVHERGDAGEQITSH